MNGDLVARLRWLADRDQATLIDVLATVDPDVLRAALRKLAGPDSAAPTGPGPADERSTGTHPITDRG